MLQVNPRFIPRNHQIEAVIRAAVDDGDYAPFHALVRVLAMPFSDEAGDAAYEAPPRPDEEVLQTFCGT